MKKTSKKKIKKFLKKYKMIIAVIIILSLKVFLNLDAEISVSDIVLFTYGVSFVTVIFPLSYYRIPSFKKHKRHLKTL